MAWDWDELKLVWTWEGTEPEDWAIYRSDSEGSLGDYFDNQTGSAYYFAPDIAGWWTVVGRNGGGSPITPYSNQVYGNPNA